LDVLLGVKDSRLGLERSWLSFLCLGKNGARGGKVLGEGVDSRVNRLKGSLSLG
jgi:hypothetical protein